MNALDLVRESNASYPLSQRHAKRMVNLLRSQLESMDAARTEWEDDEGNVFVLPDPVLRAVLVFQIEAYERAARPQRRII